MIIEDLNSQKEYFKTVKTPIFGAGVHAFNRLGLEDIAQNYRLLALRHTLETKLIEKDTEVFSLEKGMGTKHIREPRNATTVIKLPQTKEYLSKFPNPAIMVYKSSLKMERVCKENNWRLIASPIRFGKELFENKIKFRRLLQDLGVAVPPGTIKKVKDLHYGQLLNKYGLPFVIQHPTRGGGKGTFFINNQEDFHNAQRKLKFKITEEYKEIPDEVKQVIVAKYISGSSPSVTGCVTRQGILSCSPQLQILDIAELYSPKKGSGLFCGHDWTASNFSDKVKFQVYDITEKIGQYFKGQGYKGIFGLDFVMDEETEKLYVVEANPRLIGQFPTLAMAQALTGEPSILGFHVLEHLDADYELDAAKVNYLMRQPKKGAHMLMHNLTECWAKNYGVVKPGAYRLDHGKLKYLRKGYKLQHLKERNEFMITEGVPLRKSHFSPNRRLCRILTLDKALASHKELTPWAYQIIDVVYQALKVKPIRFIRLKKFFSPHFLAKG